MNTQELEAKIQNYGAFKTGSLACDRVPFFEGFRKACESNSCGMYNQCWMCPPCIGDIQDLIKEAQSYSEVVVYQTVHLIDDSFDIEGMLEAGKRHNILSQTIDAALKTEQERFLHLGSGGCRVCERCAKRDEKPCRHPEKALASLESYGISVSELASLVNMQYINGTNTVTFFGAIFL